jgi:hypothetical protein
MISFRCACGKPMQTRDDFAGKKVKCPKCGKLTTVPREATAPVPLAKPVRAPRPAAPAKETRVHAWEDRSLVQTPTPWLPGDEERFQAGIRPLREGTNIWLVLALIVVVAGTVVGLVVLSLWA